MLAWEISGALDARLNSYKRSTTYADPLGRGFPLLNAAVTGQAASCSTLDACMSSETALTFGINNIKPWIIQAKDTMQIGQEVSADFVASCRAARLKKAANPFVPTYYKI